MQYTIRPLGQWLDPITERRRSSAVFKVSWAKALRDLDRELTFLGADRVVFQIDVEEGDIRLDGMLRSNARCGFPGVRVAFDSAHGPLTYSTDAYEQAYYGDLTGWQANIRAITLGLEALRAVDRYGITKRGEQYVGWKALPAGGNAIAMGGMTATEAAQLLERLAIGDDLGPARDATVAKIAAGSHSDLKRIVREAKAAAHPDRHNGDRRLWDEVERALAVLERSA